MFIGGAWETGKKIILNARSPITRPNAEYGWSCPSRGGVSFTRVVAY